MQLLIWNHYFYYLLFVFDQFDHQGSEHPRLQFFGLHCRSATGVEPSCDIAHHISYWIETEQFLFSQGLTPQRILTPICFCRDRFEQQLVS